MYKVKAKKFIKDWNNKDLDTWQDQVIFKKFNRQFINLMKTIWDVDNKSFKWWFYYSSWFITIWDKIVYVSISDVRHFNNEWITHVLYRTAKDLKDYTWWSNNYSSLENLEDNILQLIK